MYRTVTHFATEKPVTYEVHPTDTILSLKGPVREKEGIPMDRMRLSYLGTNLANDKTLANYKITNYGSIYLRYALGGGSYCPGCIIPLLICLSAHVSLQCGEELSFNSEQILHSIKTKLTNLNTGAVKAVIGCIETCGHARCTLQNDDADYFQDHAERAIDLFTGAICNMINPYIEKYRTSNLLSSIKNSIKYDAAYESTLTKPIDIDWLTFLHETRCPICFCRFSNVQLATNVPNKYIIDDF
jgi:hypothetical protein